MSAIASVCASCGLICITLKSPPRSSRCIKCGEHIEILRAEDTDELWLQIATNPPKPYSALEVEGLLRTRFTKAVERFSERARQREEDKKLGPEWKAAAYFARKGMRQAALLKRQRRQRAKKPSL